MPTKVGIHDFGDSTTKVVDDPPSRAMTVHAPSAKFLFGMGRMVDCVWWGMLRKSLKMEGTAMIDHTGIGVADVTRSATFYDAALGALGLRRVMQLPKNDGADGVGYGVDYPIFWIDRFHPHGVKQHTAFAARNRAAVDAFHEAALKAGGTDNGPPGLRDTAKGYPPGYYAAFVLDPDGNNMEAVFRGG